MTIKIQGFFQRHKNKKNPSMYLAKLQLTALPTSTTDATEQHSRNVESTQTTERM